VSVVAAGFLIAASNPGCTVEACEFRDSARRLSARNAVIIGISPDASGPRAKFKAKYDLPFTLLCDAEKTAAQAYGVWKAKSMYGRKVMGIERTTFLIGEDGRIARIFPKVKAQGGTPPRCWKPWRPASTFTQAFLVSSQ